jgi:hypothetical protein
VPARPLSEGDLDVDPIVQFSAWFDEAAGVLEQPEAIALASADGDGVPSVRMVLLKAWDDRGFVFFTNYASRKGAELVANPHGAFALYWEPLHRQVRVQGRVEPTTPEESDRYFASRPRQSQLAAHASHQSHPWSIGPSSRARWRPRQGPLRAAPCPARPTGEASGWCPASSSSGSTARTACTTASRTGGMAPRGVSSAWPPDPRRYVLA